MRFGLNVVFWLAVAVAVFYGCHFVLASAGAKVLALVPEAGLPVTVGIWFLSALLCVLLLMLTVLFLGKR